MTKPSHHVPHGAPCRPSTQLAPCTWPLRPLLTGPKIGPYSRGCIKIYDSRTLVPWAGCPRSRANDRDLGGHELLRGEDLSGEGRWGTEEAKGKQLSSEDNVFPGPGSGAQTAAPRGRATFCGCVYPLWGKGSLPPGEGASEKARLCLTHGGCKGALARPAGSGSGLRRPLHSVGRWNCLKL